VWTLSLPIQAAVALSVRTALGKPVLFRQVRPGLHGEPFELVKFRTLHEIDPERGRVNDADRMTSLGRWLRATSLDELPTLWNVIRGDMSLVGPRPLLMSYLPRYSAEQARRHEVKPGITGLAQVSGRNALTWEDKFRFDVEYVDGHTILGDVRILAATVRSVFVREGIVADGAATAHEFRGTSDPGADA
jgi:lipopolysaccharide/colanic/teichoic acid biosynthesis glycosyltransferase